MTNPEGEGRIGLGGAIFTIVGFVIGASIFILPGAIAAEAGPGVVLAYLIAGVAAFFACLVAAQIGTLMPRSGAGFTVVAAHVSPVFGFMVIWLMICAASLAVAFLADGFGNYLAALAPGVHPTLAAFMVLVLCGLLNLAGIRSAVWTQGALVIVLMGILAAFVVVGFQRLDPANLSPFLPAGFAPVLAAVVPAFFSFAGFMMIIELGGEVKRPRRAIPVALTVSFIVVMMVYVLVSLTLVGVVNWRELGAFPAPMGEAAGRIFPPWAATALSVSVLAAAATSINAMILGYSRYVVPLARVGLLPRSWAGGGVRGANPAAGVIIILVMSGLALGLRDSLTQIATLIVAALMMVQILLGLALVRIFLANPKGRLAAVAGIFSGCGLIAVSAGFLLISLWNDGVTLGVMVVYGGVGGVVYGLRRRALRTQGVALDQRIRDEAVASEPL
ncbi:MAG: amino acid permease [Sphingomonadales bacterium]